MNVSIQYSSERNDRNERNDNDNNRRGSNNNNNNNRDNNHREYNNQRRSNGNISPVNSHDVHASRLSYDDPVNDDLDAMGDFLDDDSQWD
jgi:hypothetical protein